MKYKLSIITVIIAAFALSIVGYAAVNIERIEADFAHDMGFRVDGEQWQPRDVDGTPQSPIIYKGRSYVPVRSLLEDRGFDVDFESDTRTIILRSPVKELDKSTPLLFDTLSSHLDPDSDGDGITDTIEFELGPNTEFGLPGVEFTSETVFDLSDDATVLLDGRKLSLIELAKADEKIGLDFGKVKVVYNEQSRTAGHIEIETIEGEFTAKADFEIEISGPPFKIKITIKF